MSSPTAIVGEVIPLALRATGPTTVFTSTAGDDAPAAAASPPPTRGASAATTGGGGGGGGGGGAALPPPQPIGMEVSVPNRKREREVGEPASDAKVARVEDASVVAAVPGKKKGGRPAKEKTAESDDGIHQCVACLMTLSQRPNLGRHWLRITRRLMLRGVIPTTLSGEALGKEPRATRKEPGSIACLYAAHVQTEGRNPNGIAPPAGWVPAAGPGSAGSVARHGVPAASSSQACSCGCRICSGHGSGIFRRGF